MRHVEIARSFVFDRSARAKLTIDAGARLHPQEHWLQLKEDAAGAYSTTTPGVVRTWLAEPKKAVALTALDVQADHFKVDGTTVTAVKVRLTNGAADYWWNGTAWATPGANDWNTIETVGANIGSFPSPRKFGVVLQLSTTNKLYTPRVRVVHAAVKVADVAFIEDVVHRTLVPLLRTMRPLADLPVDVAANTTSLDLDTIKLETPYKVVTVDAAFNDTTDPEHITNILAGYDAGTRVATLSATVLAGQRLWLLLAWEPYVKVEVAERLDYYEVGKVPAVIVERPAMRGVGRRLPEPTVVRNVGALTARKLPAPVRCEVTGTLRLLTDKSVDSERLAQELLRLADANPMLRSAAVDEQYRFRLLGDVEPSRGGNSTYGSQVEFRVVDVLVFLREGEAKPLVQQLILSGDMNTTVEQGG